MEYNPNMEGNVNRVIDIAYEQKVTQTVGEFMKVHKQLSVSPPMFLMLTLIDVKGIYLAKVAYPGTPARVMYDSIPFERDHLILPEVIFSDFDRDIQQQLQPIFDIVLNAAALKREDLEFL